MTYYGAKHLADSFRTVRKNTLAIAEEIPEDKYSFKATADVMSVGEMLAHLAVSPMWQIDVHSRKMDHLDFAFFGARMQQGKAEEQAARYQGRDRPCASRRTVRSSRRSSRGWTRPRSRASCRSRRRRDRRKTRFEMLLGPKEHEMHHRGQLMLVQRLIGQVPPLTRQRQAMMAAAAASRA